MANGAGLLFGQYTHNIRPIGQGIETIETVAVGRHPFSHNIRPIGQGIET